MKTITNDLELIIDSTTVREWASRKASTALPRLTLVVLVLECYGSDGVFEAGTEEYMASPVDYGGDDGDGDGDGDDDGGGGGDGGGIAIAGKKYSGELWL
ncbi:hypothetical protein DFQ27_002669 [Actinomortierella ambigua]|uniref:Uncharacterized protein n=1 Tax=Actinomortierella ambigua TaxID=1343610 RepID=A0A9P6Q933_9FUNG|nr:hypothetical protein DFQ27_002669 [Actinomortierella ambigua]